MLRARRYRHRWEKGGTAYEVNYDRYLWSLSGMVYEHVLQPAIVEVLEMANRRTWRVWLREKFVTVYRVPDHHRYFVQGQAGWPGNLLRGAADQEIRRSNPTLLARLDAP